MGQSSAYLGLRPLILAEKGLQVSPGGGWGFDIDTMVEPNLTNHHLAAFHVAVAVTHRSTPGGHSVTRINIWRIKVAGGCLQVQNHLCVFEEPTLALSVCGCISLAGNHVASSRCSPEGSLVSVVQWSELAAKPKGALDPNSARWRLSILKSSATVGATDVLTARPLLTPS